MIQLPDRDYELLISVLKLQLRTMPKSDKRDVLAENLFAIQRRAQAVAELTWAIDLERMHDRDDPPSGAILAHLIVADDGTGRRTACGQVRTAGTHPRGWFTAAIGEAPGPPIHCGTTAGMLTNPYNLEVSR